MKSSVIFASSNPSAAPSFQFNDIYRRLTFRFLQGIEGGTLSLVENNKTHYFGGQQIPQTTDLKPIDGTVVIHDRRFYRLLLKNGSIGAGEAYMEGYWSSPDLTAVIQLICRNMNQLEQLDGGWTRLSLLFERLKHWLSPNTLNGARKNVRAHYDLSNELFATFLDKHMMYSSAMFKTNDMTLDDAATWKIQRIGEKLNLTPQDHVLEIGTGWGGLAIYLAQNFGCKITTTTISREQYEFACNRVLEADLGHLITVLDQDYRSLSGSYSKLISVEMIEAVGQKFLQTYLKKCNDLLDKGGEMLIQAITIPEQRYDYARRNVDFIQRYIFPGGSLPSIKAILHATGKVTRLQLDNIEDIGLDYAKTLNIWQQRFTENLSTVRRLDFDERFINMWKFYLSYCEGGFRERAISTSQIVLRKI